MQDRADPLAAAVADVGRRGVDGGRGCDPRSTQDEGMSRVSTEAAVAIRAGRRDVDVRDGGRGRAPGRRDVDVGEGVCLSCWANCWAGLNTANFIFYPIIFIVMGCRAVYPDRSLIIPLSSLGVVKGTVKEA
jgi:hypothetical protein